MNHLYYLNYQAQTLFDEAFSRFSDLITDEDINLFLEMLIILENYDHALIICCKHANICFDCKNNEDNIDSMEPERQLEAFSSKILKYFNNHILCKSV